MNTLEQWYADNYPTEYEQGWDAYKKGFVYVNPHEQGSKQWQAFLRGYEDAERMIA